MYTSGAAEREDLVQEIVYQLWRAFPSYRRESAPAHMGLQNRHQYGDYGAAAPGSTTRARSARGGCRRRVSADVGWPRPTGGPALSGDPSPRRRRPRARHVLPRRPQLPRDRRCARPLRDQCRRAAEQGKNHGCRTSSRAWSSSMDLESIKRCWREETESLPPPLEEETVMRMLTNRTADLRRQVRRRLRREAGYYVPIMAVSAASLVGGFTVNRLLAAAPSCHARRGHGDALVGRAPHRGGAARSQPARGADRSRRRRWMRQVAPTVAVYVALFVVSAAILLGVVWWRNGVGPLFAGTLVMAALAVVWSSEADAATSSRCFDATGSTCPSASASSRNRCRKPPEPPRSPDVHSRLGSARGVSNRRAFARR